LVDIRESFHEAHKRTYGHALPERAVEVVNLRLRALGEVKATLLKPEDNDDADEFQGATYAVPGGALIGQKETADGTQMALSFRRETAETAPEAP